MILNTALVRSVLEMNLEWLLAITGIAVAPIGGLITLWVSTSNRIKALEIQMIAVKDEYSTLNRINTNLAALNTNMNTLLSDMASLTAIIHENDRRLTVVETRQNTPT